MIPSALTFVHHVQRDFRFVVNVSTTLTIRDQETEVSSPFAPTNPFNNSRGAEFAILVTSLS